MSGSKVVLIRKIKVIIKMNKNKPNSHNLNTINILYHKRPQPTPSLTHNRNIQLPTTLDQPLTTKTNHTHLHHITTRLDDSDNCDSFNDANLKYGKSQTLKESTFNRMRIHIYRKEKKTKWLDLLEKSTDPHNDMTYSQPRQPTDSYHPAPDRHRENKTSFKKKRLIDFIEKNHKIKTNSSDNEEDPKQRNTLEYTNLTFVEPIKQKFQLIQNAKNGHIAEGNRLSKLINENNLKIEFNMRKQFGLVQKRKNRNFSDNIMSRKSRSPNHPTRQKQINFQLASKRQQNDYIREQRFEAWEMGDILASKHGIVEYTNQQTHPINKHPDSTKAKPERRPRKRATLRNVKQ